MKRRRGSYHSLICMVTCHINENAGYSCLASEEIDAIRHVRIAGTGDNQLKYESEEGEEIWGELKREENKQIITVNGSYLNI